MFRVTSATLSKARLGCWVLSALVRLAALAVEQTCVAELGFVIVWKVTGF